MPPKKRRQAKAPARYGDGASGSAPRRTRPETGREKEAPPLTPPAEMATLHEQMALMLQQIQTITNVVSGMASATVPATVGGARRPAAVAGSATTADSADGAVGYPRTTQAILPQPFTVGHPATSHALAAVTQQLLDGALSPLTTRSYKKNVDMFQQFCKLELCVNNWFPSKMSAVVSFIVFCFKKMLCSFINH